jgi:hypothetical protein
MNPIKKYFKKIREKETESLENQKIMLTKRLDQLTDEMLASKCAINNFENCSNECIHFNIGSIFLLDEKNIYTFNNKYFMIRPSCKLWRN